MKTIKNLFNTVVLVLLSLFLTSCHKCDNIDLDDSDDIIYSSRMASDETVNYPTAIIGAIPNDIGAAFNIRFTNKTDQIMPDTRIVIVHMNHFGSIDEEALMQVYYNGGIVIILEADYLVLEAWFADREMSFALFPPEPNSNAPEVPREVYAFNQYDNHYFLDYLSQDFEHNEFLNPFVKWVNKYAPTQVPPPLNANEPFDVKKLFNYQTIDHTYNVYLKKEEAKVVASSADIIERSGQIDVKITSYPLYAFQDQASRGDYYIVSLIITAHNEQMYAGNWTQKHGGVSTRLCGFYMEKLQVTTEILNTNFSAVSGAGFASGGNPVPTTTIGSTSYTSGFSWTLGGSITGQVGTNNSIGATVNAGITFSDSETRIISDLDIKNNWLGSTVNYTYVFNNLPYYQNLKIQVPALLYRTNAEFRQDWIWRLPNTSDHSAEKFVLKNTITPQYGSCHFFSSGADMVWHEWYDAVQGNNYFTYTLTPPSRVPTGQLRINNAFTDGRTFTDIRIWKESSPTTGNPDYIISSSFAQGQMMTKDLPVGSYKIQLKAGLTAGSLESYRLINNVMITRGNNCNLNAGLIDFTHGTY